MKANDNVRGDSKFPVEAIFRLLERARPIIFQQDGADPIGELRANPSDGRPLLPARRGELRLRLGMHVGGRLPRPWPDPAFAEISAPWRRKRRPPGDAADVLVCPATLGDAVLAIARTEDDDKKLIFQDYRRWWIALVGRE